MSGGNFNKSELLGSMNEADQTPLVDAENPWPGLASFTENQQAFFHGRGKDSADLLRMVKRQSLTVVYGRSGLGKSSLLQAGLFPLLRKEDGLPIYIRLDHSRDALPLVQQVFDELTKAATAVGVEFTKPTGLKTLWEYFQNTKNEFWTAQNRPATPVLVFDQFEEIFTHGQRDDTTRKRAADFIEALGDLVENRIPESVNERFNSSALDVQDFEFDQSRCKVVLALREDYVPQLPSLRSNLTSLTVISNWMHVDPMSSEQALEAVCQPGSQIIDREVAEKIVAFVGSSTTQRTGGDATNVSAKGEVEPALLSVVCFELNRKRRRMGLPKITANLLDESSHEILQEFYENSVSDLPQSVREFVEDRLLTTAGHRNSEDLDEALRVPGMTADVLEKLIRRRLLRRDDRLGATRVELTHDRLAEPVRASREARKKRIQEEYDKRAANESRLQNEQVVAQRRRRVQIAAGLIVGFVGLVFLGAFAWVEAKHRREADALNGQIQEQLTANKKNTDEIARQSAEIQKLIRNVIPQYVQGASSLQDAIDNGYGSAFLLHWNSMIQMAGTGLPLAREMNIFASQGEYATDAMAKLEETAVQVLFTARGEQMAVRTADGKLIILAQNKPLNHWEPVQSPSLGAAALMVARHPTNPNAFAILTADSQISFWDCAAGKLIDTPVKLPSRVDATATTVPFIFTSDGAKVFVAMADSAIHSFDVASSKELGNAVMLVWHSDADGDVPIRAARHLASMNNGNYIVADTENGLWLWDSASLMLLGKLGPPAAFAISADTRTLVIAHTESSDRNHKTYESDRIQIKLIDADSDGQMAFGPDDQRIVLNEGADVRVYRASPGKGEGYDQIWHQEQGEYSTSAIAFRPDGKTIVAALDDESGSHWLKLWSAIPQPGAIFVDKPIAVSPNGHFRIHRQENVARVYRDDKQLMQLKTPANVTIFDMAIDNAGNAFAVTSDSEKTEPVSELVNVKIWRWETGTPDATNIRSIDIPAIQAVRLSPDGAHLGVVAFDRRGNVAIELPVEAGADDYREPLINDHQDTDDVGVVAGSLLGGPDGRILIGRKSGIVTIASLDSQKEIPIQTLHHPARMYGDADAIYGAAFVPGMDKPAAMTIGKDDVVFWDVQSAKRLPPLDVNDVVGQHWDIVSASVSNGAKVFAAASEDAFFIWHQKEDGTYEHSEKFETADTAGSIHEIQLSPDGQRLVVAGKKGAWTFSAVTGEKEHKLDFLAQVERPQDAPAGGRGADRLSTSSDEAATEALHAAVSPDGQQVAVVDGTGALHVFAASSGNLSPWQNLKLDLKLPISFTPDGSAVVAIEGGQIHLVGKQSDVTIPRARGSAGAILATCVPAQGGNENRVELLSILSDGGWEVKYSDSPNAIESVPGTIEFGDRPPILAVSSDGKIAVGSGTTNGICLLTPVPGSAPKRMHLKTTLSLHALAFALNGNAIFHVEESRSGSHYVSLVSFDGKEGKEVVSRKLPRAVSRLVPSPDWLSLNYDAPSSDYTILRPRNLTPEQCVLETGLEMDESSFQWKPLTFSQHSERFAKVAATPLDSLSAEFWAAWWKSKSREENLLQLPDITLAQLTDAFAPLTTYLRDHPDAPDELRLHATELLASLSPPVNLPAGEALATQIDSLKSRPLAERIVMLSNMIGRATDNSDVGELHAALAVAILDRVDASLLVEGLHDVLIRQAMEHVLAADHAGYTPPPSEEKQFKPLLGEDSFPLAWLSVDSLDDRAWDLMKPNTRADNLAALKILDVACDRDAKAYLPWLHRSIVLGRLNQHEAAVNNYLKMLEVQGETMTKDDHARVLANLGFRYSQWGRDHYPQAYEALAKALEIDPEYTTTYSYRVDLYMDERKYDLAWDDAQKLPENDAGADNTRAQILLALGRNEEAIVQLDAMTNLDKTDPDRWLDRANTLIDCKNRAMLPNAIDAAAEAIRLMIDRPEPDAAKLRNYHERRGVALRRLGRLAEASDDFRAMLKDDPQQPFAIAELGAIQTSMGDPQAAIRMIGQSINLDNGDSWALDQLARAYMQLNPPNHLQAMIAANKAVDVSDSWLGRRAEIFRRDGQASLASAEQDLDQAVKLGIEPIQSRVALSGVLAMRGRLDDARATAQQALDYKPWIGDDDRRARSLAYAYLGQYDEALNELQLVNGERSLDSDRYFVSAQINALKASAGGSRGVRAEDPIVLAAIHDLMLFVRFGTPDWSDISSALAIQPIEQEPLVRQMIAALQRPVSDRERDLAMIRVAFALRARLQRDDSIIPQMKVDCVLSQQEFERWARDHGASSAQIEAARTEPAAPAPAAQ